MKRTPINSAEFSPFRAPGPGFSKGFTAEQRERAEATKARRRAGNLPPLRALSDSLPQFSGGPVTLTFSPGEGWTLDALTSVFTHGHYEHDGRVSYVASLAHVKTCLSAAKELLVGLRTAIAERGLADV